MCFIRYMILHSHRIITAGTMVVTYILWRSRGKVNTTKQLTYYIQKIYMSIPLRSSKHNVSSVACWEVLLWGGTFIEEEMAPPPREIESDQILHLIMLQGTKNDANTFTPRNYGNQEQAVLGP